MLIGFGIIKDNIISILLFLDTIIYSLVAKAYEIFLMLASQRFIDNGAISGLMNRIELIIGVVALFIVAFNLLKGIIDPDSGVKNSSKLVKNIVISIILLVTVNWIFDATYKIQDAILKSNVIGNVIIGGFSTTENYQEALNNLKANDEVSDDETLVNSLIQNGGVKMANDVFSAFFNYSTDYSGCFIKEDYEYKEFSEYSESEQENLSEEIVKGNNECYYVIDEDKETEYKIKGLIFGVIGGAAVLALGVATGGVGFVIVAGVAGATIGSVLGHIQDVFTSNHTSLGVVYINSMLTGDFSCYQTLVRSITNGFIEYNGLISLIAGVFLLYIIASFCLDLGLRVVKLAFYQMISPIAIISRILPGKESIFNTWLKETISTFLEVFIKVAIIYFGILLITVVPNSINWIDSNNILLKGLANACIILGIVAFMKQAPKLICDIFGIKSSGFKTIKQKLKDSGAFVAAGAVGGAAIGLGRNAVDAVKNGKSNMGSSQGFWSKTKTLGKILGSGLLSSAGGATSGLYHGGKTGLKASSYKDALNSMKTGADISTTNRVLRDQNLEKNGGFVGSVKASILDKARSTAEFITGNPLGYEAKIAAKQKVVDAFSDYESIIDNPNLSAMKSQLNNLNALRAGGMSTYEGQDINNMIAKLKFKVAESKATSIRNNKDATAYAAYNIANEFKKSNSPEFIDSLKSKGFSDTFIKNLVNDDFKLLGDTVVHKDNKEYTHEELTDLFIGTKYGNAVRDAKAGKPVDENELSARADQDNLEALKRNTKNEIKRETSSVRYKEIQKEKENKQDKK